MRRAPFHLVLLALVPSALIPTESDAGARKWPAGEAIYRPSCFDEMTEQPLVRRDYDDYEGGVVGGVATGSAGRGGSTNVKSKPSSAPPPSPAPMADAYAQAAAEDQRRAQQARTAAEAQQRSEQERMSQAPPERRPMEPKASPAQPSKKTKDTSFDFANQPPAGAIAPPREDRQTRPRPPMEPSLDWGATVYLSNDDSMSLASAQRMLYAVMNNQRLQTREIRPHELLNYFSFDTVEPTPAQLFDVLASAEQDGDTLQVALAVKGATPPRQPLDLTMIVDVSCSMRAEGRMEYTQRGLDVMREQLSDGDRVDVVLFDHRVCTPLENFVVGRDDPKLLEQTVARMKPLGGTDVGLGLRKGYEIARNKADGRGRNRRMMLVTDAQMNTGDVDANTVSEIGRAYEKEGIRLTGVGVGRDFRDDVLDMLTEKGKGAYVYLGSEAVVDRVFGIGFDSLTRTIAHDVQFALELPKSLAMERFYGEEASTVAADVQPIHYYAGTSQVFLQDLRIKDGRAVRSDPVNLTIKYRDAITGEPETRVFRTTIGKMLDADPHNVRKAKALMKWSDVLLAQSMGGDPCGDTLRSYGSVASKVAADAEIAFVNGLVTARCPAFTLPAHVAEAARVSYKVRVDSDIPIAEVSLACAGRSWRERLTGSTTIARFDAVPGACTLTLAGTVDMTAKVEVPTTGGDARCVVRGGRLSCS